MPPSRAFRLSGGFLSMSSTAVVLKCLMDSNTLHTEAGQVRARGALQWHTEAGQVRARGALQWHAVAVAGKRAAQGQRHDLEYAARMWMLAEAHADPFLGSRTQGRMRMTRELLVLLV